MHFNSNDEEVPQLPPQVHSIEANFQFRILRWTFDCEYRSDDKEIEQRRGRIRSFEPKAFNFSRGNVPINQKKGKPYEGNIVVVSTNKEDDHVRSNWATRRCRKDEPGRRAGFKTRWIFYKKNNLQNEFHSKQSKKFVANLMLRCNTGRAQNSEASHLEPYLNIRTWKWCIECGTISIHFAQSHDSCSTRARSFDEYLVRCSCIDVAGQFESIWFISPKALILFVFIIEWVGFDQERVLQSKQSKASRRILRTRKQLSARLSSTHPTANYQRRHHGLGRRPLVQHHKLNSNWTSKHFESKPSTEFWRRTTPNLYPAATTTSVNDWRVLCELQCSAQFNQDAPAKFESATSKQELELRRRRSLWSARMPNSLNLDFRFEFEEG